MEHGFLKGASDYVSLVDRSNLDLLNEELSLQLSGPISKNTITKIGDMSGANYIMTGILNVYPDNINNTLFEHLTSQLIEIKTGEIKAIDFKEFYYIWSDTEGGYILDSYYLNYEQIELD